MKLARLLPNSTNACGAIPAENELSQVRVGNVGTLYIADDQRLHRAALPGLTDDSLVGQVASLFAGNLPFSICTATCLLSPG